MKKKTPSSAKDKTGLSNKKMLGLYEQMYLVRHFELTAQKLYKDGKLPGFVHLYIGEEAVAVGVCASLTKDDLICSTHRGHGHALAKGVPPKFVLSELWGKAAGCSGGRGGSMHIYAPQYGLMGTNGMVGGGVPSAVGIAMAADVRKTGQVVISFFGDGAVNHGAFLESVNLAAIRKAPVVFVCENNLYATCVPISYATANTDFVEKARGYGLPGASVDGNDVLAVLEAAQEAVNRARDGKGPTLIEARTYRHSGHQEGDPATGTYRTEEELNRWLKRCPLKNFKAYLKRNGIASAGKISELEKQIDAQMAEAVEFACGAPPPDPASRDLYVFADPINPPMPEQPKKPRETKVQTWNEAIIDVFKQEMRRDPNIIYLGEGVGARGGCFAHTKGLWDEFGGERLIDTPICELAFTGAALGAAAHGCRAVSDLMITDFMYEAASQIVLHAAKLRYMSNNQLNAPMIIRSGMGLVKQTGPQHSGTYYPAWAHVPGLIIVIPSNPADAKGLMTTALRAYDPVIFLDHKALFSSKGPVPQGEYMIPFGCANVVREGDDLTVATCGVHVDRCVAAAEQLQAQGVSCEIIDLRTIVPLDVDTIVNSVRKTGRILVVDEAYSMCGIGAEIAATVMEHAFDHLDAPVGRLHTDPLAYPFAPSLDDELHLTVDKVADAMRKVVAGDAIIQKRAAAGFMAGHKEVSTVSVPETTVSAPIAEKPEKKAGTAATADGIPIIMPNVDLTITEATVVKWLKAVGDPVKNEETVVEVETEKAVLEVEAPADGILAEILADEGTVVALGEQLGIINPS